MKVIVALAVRRFRRRAKAAALFSVLPYLKLRASPGAFRKSED